MKWKSCLLGALLVLVPVAGVRAQEDYKKLPGYVDFSAMGIFGEEESTVEVFLKGPLLRLVSEATKDEDSELADMLSRLRLIRVQVFPLRRQKAALVAKKAAEMARQLEKKGWEMVVRVRDRDEQVYVYLKSVKDRIAGLAVMSVEPGNEAAFINIVGDIDPAQIGRLGRKFDIQPLDSIRIDFKKSKSRR